MRRRPLCRIPDLQRQRRAELRGLHRREDVFTLCPPPSRDKLVDRFLQERQPLIRGARGPTGRNHLDNFKTPTLSPFEDLQQLPSHHIFPQYWCVNATTLAPADSRQPQNDCTFVPMLLLHFAQQMSVSRPQYVRVKFLFPQQDKEGIPPDQQVEFLMEKIWLFLLTGA